MDIDVITPSLSKTSGGVGPAVESLYDNITARYSSINIDTLTLSGGRGEHWGREFSVVPPRRLGLSVDLLLHAFKTSADLVHTHGVWMATSAYQNIAHKFLDIPFVISPHGMLDPWIMNQGCIQKNVAKMCYEKRAWNKCSAFHALNDAEADAIRKIAPKAKIYVIPNGIQIPPLNHALSLDNNGFFNVLFLGRLHPKKNVVSLVKAVSKVSDRVYRLRPFKLLLAGWGEPEYVELVRTEIKNAKGRVEYVGPVFGKEKLEIFKRTSSFVLPSFSEGMPVAVLEAWSMGCPVLMSSHCNLTGAFSAGAAIEVGTNIDSLVAGLEALLQMPDSEILDIGNAGYSYVKEHYNWDKVCSAFYALYIEVQQAHFR